MTDSGYERIEAWHRRVHAALADAITYLADCDDAPVPDGMLGAWIDTLVAMRFEPDDAAIVARIIDKRDPLMQEAGVRLARSALGATTSAGEIEAALARLVSPEHGHDGIDSWVLEALVNLLADVEQPLVPVYRGLAQMHGRSRRGIGIMRNRHIEPWRRVVELYQQHAIQTLEPNARDLAYLPVLERELGTRGWLATQRHILTSMGFEPEQHLRLLRRRP